VPEKVDVLVVRSFPRRPEEVKLLREERNGFVGFADNELHSFFEVVIGDLGRLELSPHRRFRDADRVFVPAPPVPPRSGDDRRPSVGLRVVSDVKVHASLRGDCDEIAPHDEVSRRHGEDESKSAEGDKKSLTDPRARRRFPSPRGAPPPERKTNGKAAARMSIGGRVIAASPRRRPDTIKSPVERLSVAAASVVSRASVRKNEKGFEKEIPLEVNEGPVQGGEQTGDERHSTDKKPAGEGVDEDRAQSAP